MKNRAIKRMLALSLAAVMSLTACGLTTNSNNVPSEKEETTVTSEPVTEETKEAPKEIVPVTMYPSSTAITSGAIGGWKGEMLADIGVQLEVWAFSADKTNAILASEELPDLFFVSNKDQLEVLLENDLIMDLTPYLDSFACINDYYSSWETYVANQQAKDTGYAAMFGNDDYAGKFYVMPNEAGDIKTSADTLLRYTGGNEVRVRWEAYEAIGAPTITNWTELLDATEAMWDIWPTAGDGNATYGMYLEDGSNGIKSRFDPVRMFLWWNGCIDNYTKWGYIANMVTAEIEDIYADNSIFYQALQFLNDAWNRGLIDKDSINTPRKEASSKTKYTVLPNGSLPGYAPDYLELYIPGLTIFGNKAVTRLAEGATPPVKGWVVSKKCENVEAVIDLLALWADSDNALEWYWGPEGDIWYLDDKGNAMLTEEYLAYAKLPADTRGDFVLSTGEPWVWWNHNIIAQSSTLTTYGDGEGGFRGVHVQYWPEYELAVSEGSEVFKNWQETTGFESWKDLVENKEGSFCSYSPVQYISTWINPKVADVDDATALAAQSCLTALQDYSWKMIVAPTEAEFTKLWAELKTTVEAYGLADVQNYFKVVWAESMVDCYKNGYGPEGDMIVNWDNLTSPWHK